MTHTASRAVSQARTGDRDALLYLYAVYADDVYGHARAIVDDHKRALRVTQCVFDRLTSLLDRYEEREVPFAVWIRRVAHSVAAETLVRSETQRRSYSS